jgi:HD superfamily phosphodiesterase
MKEILIKKMKEVFGADTRRINHALSVLDFAEQIHSKEGGDLQVVEAAAILHDIGIQQAEHKYGSSAGKYQEIEGPPIAKKILEEQNFSGDKIKHICRIIANHHSDADIDTPEFRIVWDSDRLVNIAEEFGDIGKEKLKKFIYRVFKTNTGRRIAQELYINK